MPKYKVIRKYKAVDVVSVEALSPEDAIQKAKELRKNPFLVIASAEFSDMEKWIAELQ